MHSFSLTEDYSSYRIPLPPRDPCPLHYSTYLQIGKKNRKQLITKTSATTIHHSTSDHTPGSKYSRISGVWSFSSSAIVSPRALWYRMPHNHDQDSRATLGLRSPSLGGARPSARSLGRFCFAAHEVPHIRPAFSFLRPSSKPITCVSVSLIASCSADLV